MKSLLRGLAIGVVTLAALVSMARAADPRDAVVRIPSHGGSGTVIETGPGKTVILSAAHVFVDPKSGAFSSQPIKIDVPDVSVEGGLAPHKAKMRVARVTNFQTSDLALLEVDDGPWPAVCPVAPAGHRPSQNLLSVGYGQMKTPAMQVRSTIVAGVLQNDRTFTREAPTPGMSGGALIDVDAGVLIGVTSARNNFGQGVYVKHADILAFLGKSNTAGPGASPPRGYIRIEEDRDGQPTPPPQPQPQQPGLQIGGPFFGPYCPDGRCPNQPRTAPGESAAPKAWDPHWRLKVMPSVPPRVTRAE